MARLKERSTQSQPDYIARIPRFEGLLFMVLTKALTDEVSFSYTHLWEEFQTSAAATDMPTPEPSDFRTAIATLEHLEILTIDENTDSVQLTANK